MFSRKFLEKLELFPKELFFGFGQDLYAGIFAEKNNLKVGVMDNVPIYHYKGHTVRNVKELNGFNTLAYNQLEEYAGANLHEIGLKMKSFREYGIRYKHEL
jgi:hypothetical protein